MRFEKTLQQHLIPETVSSLLDNSHSSRWTAIWVNRPFNWFLFLISQPCVTISHHLQIPRYNPAVLHCIVILFFSSYCMFVLRWDAFICPLGYFPCVYELVICILPFFSFFVSNAFHHSFSWPCLYIVSVQANSSVFLYYKSVIDAYLWGWKLFPQV